MSTSVPAGVLAASRRVDVTGLRCTSGSERYPAMVLGLVMTLRLAVVLGLVMTLRLAGLLGRGL
jgi:hypothetical protein